MVKLLGFYTKYQDKVPEYNSWKEQQNEGTQKVCSNKNSLQKKAETIAQPLLLVDSYEHSKAEDSETFFQTYNIELMSITTLLASLPLAVTKAIPLLKNKAGKSELLKKTTNILESYKNASVNIAGKNISIPKIATIITAIGSGIFYVNAMKNSMKSQLGIIRKASFDATKEIIENPKLFAITTNEQEKQINEAAEKEVKSSSAFVEDLKDKVNINSSFKAVKNYKANYKDFNKQKGNYFETIENKKPLNEKEKANAKENQEIIESYLKNVEHDALEPLERIEKISNISYSSLYLGGFLEYLVSDKLVDILKIKNKPLQLAVKIGGPLLTYLLLNRNIANIENKAILATKYKYLKKFMEDPTSFKNPKNGEKESFGKFVKTVYQDMKQYDKFAQTELPKIDAKMDAKRQLNLTQTQMKDAKALQEDTIMAINTQREHLYNQSVGIKAFSETILQPIDLVATAIGGKLGYNIAKKFPNNKHIALFTGIGSIIAFIPAAIIEAKLTKQQKLSEKTAAMMAIKDLQDINRFSANNSNEKTSSNSKIKTPEIFKEISV